MLFHQLLFLFVANTIISVSAQSTQALHDLISRRLLPGHAAQFSFSFSKDYKSPTELRNDSYVISTSTSNTIAISGNSLTALTSGLHRYLTDIAHVDIYWFIGSRLHLAPSYLPRPKSPVLGSSIVPWRYHFNTVTFSYTAAFWTWDDWEFELDWLALRGVNLPLAWVGAEKILVQVFQEIGLTDSDIASFLSGPAFQAWNRFGNIQGSWGPGNTTLPMSWIDSQFELQKKILARMVELGMTPVLPAFTGYVPRAILTVLPNATVVNGSQWGGFSPQYSNDTFLEPSDEAFTRLQKSFISKQIAAYGNITRFYTLDQYNENDPHSGDLDYLRNVMYNTWQSLKAADPAAVWLMQGWLFYEKSYFWTDARIKAYLSGVEVDEDMLILDLFSEYQPQWQRTNSYFGKPWIWCQVHDFGGNMGLYGQVMNVTINPIEALHNSSSLVGFGLTPEGQEGNEIMYDLLLDQAWDGSPIDTAAYFRKWVRTRYVGNNSIPENLYSAWDTLRTSVYNNTNLTNAMPKSLIELSPNITGLFGPTSLQRTALHYDPEEVVVAWNFLHDASAVDPRLWDNPSYQYDLVDVTRQVLTNAFIPAYLQFIRCWNSSTGSAEQVNATGAELIYMIDDLDRVLSTNEAFSLSRWLDAARAWANATATAPASPQPLTPSASGTSTSNATSQLADFYEYDARNQITLWGPNGEISDYASKAWGGLMTSYYKPRWCIFVNYLVQHRGPDYNGTELAGLLRKFELGWQTEKDIPRNRNREGESLDKIIEDLVTRLPVVFGKTG
ncbi:glycoside hydrolase family 89 protein [Glonium stellatum]|uniref:Glycoside hydrolase family 89 protein n=1 Tax=Glonium stellatum TaxID=574774 RepID=A0A8E2FBM0_9PEZI|nr:glycoside hydrolase family 89 protein [Glonium stellatum]